MDFKQIQSIIKDFENSNLTTLEIESDGFKLKLNKNIVQEPIIEKTIIETPKQKIEDPTSTPKGYEVKSPLVGTFYAASSPKDRPFVSVGQKVEEGDTLCIIEAMKIMNEITAPVSGVIESINIKNESPVGYDQVLMVIV